MKSLVADGPDAISPATPLRLRGLFLPSPAVAGERSRIPRLLFRIFAPLTVLALAVWAASSARPMSVQTRAGDYALITSTDRAGLALTLFRDIPEDDFYHHLVISYWQLTTAFAAIAVVSRWGIGRAHRRAMGRGFPL